jgi:hypothetical protein
MRATTKIRFTEPQIALVMRAHPDCNLDHLNSISPCGAFAQVQCGRPPHRYRCGLLFLRPYEPTNGLEPSSRRETSMGRLLEVLEKHLPLPAL